jgi:hypothetical protein
MRIAKAGSVALVALLLAACSDDDDPVTPVPPPPPPPPTVTGAAGFWNGTTSANRELRGAILDNGQLWMFYGGVGAPGSIAGFLQGSGTETATTYTSSNTLDFNLEGPSRQAATFTSTYTAKSTLNGSVTYPVTNTTGTFTTRYDSNYDRPASLTAIAGTYAGTGDGTTTTTTISATGVISGSSSGGCRFTGSTTPRTAGNVYDYSITFGAAPCDLQNQTLRGVATLDAAGRTLVAAGLDANRTAGFVFFGTKAGTADSPTAKSTAFGGFTGTVKGEGLLILR